MPKLSEWLTGSPDRFEQLPNYNQGQNQNLNQLTDLTGRYGEGVGSVLEYLMSFLDPNSEEYKNFEAPYRQEFEQETVPMLAEQYAGKGALSSSGFGQALGSAGAGLQTKLAALKSGLRAQAANSILGQYNTQTGQSLGARPFDYRQREGNSGLLNTAIAAGVGGLTGGGGFGALISSLMSKYGVGSGSGAGGRIGGKVG